MFEILVRSFCVFLVFVIVIKIGNLRYKLQTLINQIQLLKSVGRKKKEYECIQMYFPHRTHLEKI